VGEGGADAAMETPDLTGVEAPGLAERVDARAPERLVHVDVPHPGERPLVEQCRLDGSAAAGETAAEMGRGKHGIERLLADPCGEVRLGFARLEHQPGAESPDVAIRDVRSVV
jgi:hypothetical protein